MMVMTICSLQLSDRAGYFEIPTVSLRMSRRKQVSPDPNEFSTERGMDGFRSRR